MIAYMLTWTTYGTWLQGDERGYCKDGKTLDPNPGLYNANCNALKQSPVFLTKPQRDAAKNAIQAEALRIGQQIHAIAVQTDHVHLILAKTPATIESAAHRYKRTATYALRKEGKRGNIWTRKYDKRFCFDQRQLNARIEYVLKHDVKTATRPSQQSCEG